MNSPSHLGGVGRSGRALGRARGEDRYKDIELKLELYFLPNWDNNGTRTVPEVRDTVG